MRKHYFTAVLGIIFCAFLVALHLNLNIGFHTELTCPTETVAKTDASDRISTVVKNNLSLVLKKTIDFIIR